MLCGGRDRIRFRLRCRADAVAHLDQQVGKQPADNRIIFHQKNAQSLHNFRAPRNPGSMYRDLS